MIVASSLQPSIDRVSEIACILAIGLMRHLASKSSPNSADIGESPLDILATESGHTASVERRKSDD